MKKVFMLSASGLAIFSIVGCGDGSTEPTPTDTVVVTQTDTVVETVEATVDTAAIIAFWQAEHAKAKGTHQPKSKKQGTKDVSADSDPIFVADDVMPAPAPPPQSAPAKEAPAPAPAPEVKVIHDVQMYYYIPDEKASFPGGEKAFDEYLTKNLQYPEKAQEAGVSRTVYPTVYLDEQGNPTDVKFRYEPTIYGFQDEARRILMASPRWNPAKHNGQPVKSKFTIPITFKIQ